MSSGMHCGPRSNELGKMPNSKVHQLRQLGASIVCLIAAGERQAEIIRKVAFELNDFQAYRIFRALAQHHQHQISDSMENTANEGHAMYLRKKNEAELEVINEQSMFGFFQSYYEGASGEEEISSILKRQIDEQEAKFLVRLMDKNQQGYVTYEEFLDFILPKTKKRFSQAFVRKVSKKEKCKSRYDNINPNTALQQQLMMRRFDVSYDAICSLCRLFEKEVELFRMISKLIKKLAQNNNGQEPLQMSDLFSALDFQGNGRLTKKRLKQIVFTYAGQGGACELQEADLAAVLRRLDHDLDAQISFSDFFHRLLPYFVYTPGLGVTQQNQRPYKAVTRADRLDLLTEDPLPASPSPLFKKTRTKLKSNKSSKSLTTNHRQSVTSQSYNPPPITGHLRVRTADRKAPSYMNQQPILAAHNLHDHNYYSHQSSSHHHHRPTYPGPQSIFDRHLASSYEESDHKNHPNHNVLHVKAVISRPGTGKKENRRPSVTVISQNQQEEEQQKLLDRQSYITKYASLKEMELEYLSQKNKQKFEVEQRRKQKGPKDYSNLELSPNVINIQTINRLDGGNSPSDYQNDFIAGKNVVEFSLKDSSLMPSPKRITHNVSQQQNIIPDESIEPPLNYDYNSFEMKKLFKNRKHTNSQYRVQTIKRGDPVNLPFLMKLFHDSVDYDRILEIDKQELVLQSDYNPYLLYRLFTGCQNQYLTVEQLSQLLISHFEIQHNFVDVSVMLQRQLPLYHRNDEDQNEPAILTYTDFLALMMPKNSDFATFMRRKIRDDSNAQGFGEQNQSNNNRSDEDPLLSQGVSEDTHLKLRKLFLDALILENELERQRRSPELRAEVEDAHLVVFNTMIDRNRKGYSTVEDYLEFFKEHYYGGLPYTHDDICYLFKRHDRFKQGKVVSSDFLRDITPLTSHLEPLIQTGRQDIESEQND